jgi:hypothetical protein
MVKKMESSMNIKDFCAENDRRDYLKQPFNIDGRTVASNGAVLLSTQLSAEYDELKEGEATGVKEVLARFDATKLTPMPIIPLPDPVECSICGGRGTAHKKQCVECDGEGEVSLDNCFNDYECECKSCGGDGFVVSKHGTETCFSCNGDGKRYPEYLTVNVLGVKVNIKYLKLIINVPDLHVFTDAEASMLWFKSGDDYGVMMGMLE